jgi:hypothetical protein
MGARSSTPLASNDVRFLNSVITGAGELKVASSPFPPSQVLYCCKPLCHTKHCTLALPYPSHPEFAKRISQEAWRQLNADLVEEMYQETFPCLWYTKNISAFVKFNLTNHRSLYKVIAHYNRHLFHPMLIDAQIFAFHNQSCGTFVSTLAFVFDPSWNPNHCLLL